MENNQKIDKKGKTKEIKSKNQENKTKIKLKDKKNIISLY